MTSLTASLSLIRHAINLCTAIRMGVAGLAVCACVASCSDSGQMAATETPSKVQPEQMVADDQADDQTDNQKDDQSDASKTPTTDKSQGNGDSAKVNTPVQGQPVRYDVTGWTAEEGERFGIDDLDKMQAIFGKLTVTDENSLDYASNTAIKYRFMKGDKPYLDIIDSQEYLEYGWYFANPNDSDEEKKASISHAKKVYKAAEGLMGDAGGELVASMLSGQITKDKEIGGQSIALAKCEFYSCMLIIKKPS